MTLPETCPKCGAPYSVERQTFLYGKPREFSLLACTRCDYEEIENEG